MENSHFFLPCLEKGFFTKFCIKAVGHYIRFQKHRLQKLYYQFHGMKTALWTASCIQ